MWFNMLSCSEYEVECACTKAQCPVRKAGRKLKKCLPRSSGDHSSAQNGRTTTLPREPPAKRSVHEKLKVEIPSNDVPQQVVRIPSFY